MTTTNGRTSKYTFSNALIKIFSFYFNITINFKAFVQVHSRHADLCPCEIHQQQQAHGRLAADGEQQDRRGSTKGQVAKINDTFPTISDFTEFF